jgi:hypothetical protein
MLVTPAAAFAARGRVRALSARLYLVEWLVAGAAEEFGGVAASQRPRAGGPIHDRGARCRGVWAVPP